MENKQLIKQSLDMKYYRAQLILCGIVVVLFDLMVSVLIPLSESPAEIVVLAVLCNVFLLGVIGYQIFKAVEILRSPEHYRIYEAVAKEAHHVARGRTYFTLLISAPDGSELEVETNGIFGGSIMTDRYWGNAMGQRLQILYDESTERVVVLKRLED